MTYLQALLLGCVQGLTEFFPVSSSGHLKLFQIFFGWRDLGQFILFDLVCHLGTLLAIILVLKKDIISLLTEKKRDILSLIVALLPLLPLYFLLKAIHEIYNTPQLLGFFFLVTALLLWIGERCKEKPTFIQGVKAPFIIGCFQALAILPGVSRSGSTIASARFMGWSYEKAFRFSFLLAIPTIVGGSLVEGRSLMKEDVSVIPLELGHYIVGFIVSFIVGVFALRVLLKLLVKRRISLFIGYCVIVGLFTIIYTNWMLG